jgi:signal transduction histidine kinase/DNA-binding NarL/FixJ family response regulator
MKPEAGESKTAETNLYFKEFALLERVKEIIEKGDFSKDEILKEFADFHTEYDKLLKGIVKISRIADANQRKLMRTLELEKRNLLLEQVVKERTQEIGDKNRQLEEQSEKLKEMDRVKSRFLTNISHEFRTPLTLIMGPLEQMIAGDGDYSGMDKKKKHIMMLRNAQRLLRLINQLLELSKLDSGRMKLQAGKTDIVSFIKVIVTYFQSLADQNELDLVFDNTLEHEDRFLYIDHRKIEDVMSNILINAVKFTPPGGQISVTIKETPPEYENYPEGAVEISVGDTGPGIPAMQLRHIFNRFYEAKSTAERRQKGSGIGLALAKELVELHHGTISVNSREGDGSTFSVQLPKGSGHLAAEQKTGHAEPPNMTQSLESQMLESVIEVEGENEPKSRFYLEGDPAAKEPAIILVVDDSPEMRGYIRESLEPDYTVIEAGDGKEGIDKARKSVPDLIVSDVMMPGVNGYELCRTLKNDVNTSHIPVILLTVKASEDSVVQGLESGADDYITKPFSTKILSVRIKNLIDLHRDLQLTMNRELTGKPTKISVSAVEREFVEDLKKVLEENLPDPDFNVDAMCKKLYMSRPTLYRKIQAISGESPTEFIRSYRLKRASQLLESGFGSVTEVAFEVGFSSRAYFTKCFRERFHQLPSAYHPSESEAE